MNRILKILMLSLLLSTTLFAEAAKVTYVHGKVEVQRKDGNWYTLKPGDFVNESETISTGFYSDLKLEYNGSIMALGALTRITLENLSTSADTDNVSVYLNTGAVRSKVTHTKEKRVAYVVKSPVAVASVRGTDFTITASGAVTCNEGAVVVFPNVERQVTSAKANVEAEEDTEEDDETAAETEEVAVDTEVSNAGDYGPATATTPASEITTSAPAGAIVVGKDQTVSITIAGATETPMVNATKKSTQAKTTVTTAAAQETEVVGSATVTEAASTKDLPSAIDAITVKPGSITATIVLQD